MKEALADGIPTTRLYRDVLDSEIFRNMEVFSDDFLSDSRLFLQGYMKKWVSDPLHQWSRQWEYPYVYEKLRKLADAGKKLDVLDAGAGVGFFPYYIDKQFASANIHCCDYEPLLPAIYEQLNARHRTHVEFLNNDLKALSYERESFDVVYCISVLEHTDNYPLIINEFYRVLKPGGTLLVTFDVSLDGMRDIGIDQAAVLLGLLETRFGSDGGYVEMLNARLSGFDVFTTLTAQTMNPGLLPWKGPSFLHRLKSFAKSGKIGAWPPPLTVFCLGLTKPFT
ncbi:MAG: class I SAM-dependent methyltransferase [Gammaproteobacteria bacterium]|nr:class I SAM-dependent methyltransferase [Gammaproteobacteria bacterium]MCP5137711.1 class I SAM-dependent methyltransferase [Gammaproteobacteria bacterium]